MLIKGPKDHCVYEEENDDQESRYSDSWLLVMIRLLTQVKDHKDCLILSRCLTIKTSRKAREYAIYSIDFYWLKLMGELVKQLKVFFSLVKRSPLKFTQESSMIKVKLGRLKSDKRRGPLEICLIQVEA